MVTTPQKWQVLVSGQENANRLSTQTKNFTRVGLTSEWTIRRGVVILAIKKM
jgi:hypothetical protein